MTLEMDGGCESHNSYWTVEKMEVCGSDTKPPVFGLFVSCLVTPLTTGKKNQDDNEYLLSWKYLSSHTKLWLFLHHRGAYLPYDDWQPCKEVIKQLILLSVRA